MNGGDSKSNSNNDIGSISILRSMEEYWERCCCIVYIKIFSPTYWTMKHIGPSVELLPTFY